MKLLKSDPFGIELSIDQTSYSYLKNSPDAKLSKPRRIYEVNIHTFIEPASKESDSNIDPKEKIQVTLDLVEQLKDLANELEQAAYKELSKCDKKQEQDSRTEFTHFMG